jgi:hypothetical protein
MLRTTKLKLKAIKTKEQQKFLSYITLLETKITNFGDPHTVN